MTKLGVFKQSIDYEIALYLRQQYKINGIFKWEDFKYHMGHVFPGRYKEVKK
jgi:hypothetical protein